MTDKKREKKGKHEYEYDLIVIGAGSGGVRCSRISATHGAKVALIESFKVGGTCVLRGCVPKKLLWYGAAIGRTISESHNYGWNFDSFHEDLKKGEILNWERMIDNKNTELDRLNKVYMTNLTKAGVEIFDGFGTFIDAHTIQIETNDADSSHLDSLDFEKNSKKVLGTPGSKTSKKTITADKIVIATGSWPFLPEVEGIESGVMSSNEILEMKTLPLKQGIVIVGGGYIAVEFATVMNSIGVPVTQVYRSELILRGFDDDIRKTVSENNNKVGIKLHTNTDVIKIEKSESSGIYTLTLQSTKDKSAKPFTIEAERVLYATGRKPNHETLNISKLGIKIKGGHGGENGEGGIMVDENSKTNIDNIYAVGDVTDRIMLTPVAIHEGHVLADNLFGGKNRKIDHSNVASAVFSNPGASSCGLTEEQAAKKYGDDKIDIYVANFTPMFHSISKAGLKSMMKLVVERESDKIVGCHIVDEHAAETMQAVAVAIRCGVKKSDFDATIGIHPTAAEELVTLRTKRD